ncbi:MAG: inner-membrane translocator [Thermodesulfobacteriota bacterium]
MSTKEKISLFLLIVVYLLVCIRYFPGRPLETLTATMSHLLESVPYIIALTVLVVSVMQKVVGQRLPKNRIARIYLTFGLIAEFFFGMYHYLKLGQI